MLLSIDIGIKNMSYCLVNDSDEIVDWNIINLCRVEKCSCETKKGQCLKPGRYICNNKYYCTTHSNKTGIPKVSKTFSKYLDEKRISKKDGETMFAELGVSDTQSREEVLAHVYRNFMVDVVTRDTKSVSLIDIGKYINKYIPEYIDVSRLTCVIIENQISTIASRMKVIQGMVTQFFICNCADIKIDYISSINKLKYHDVPKKTYKDRKKSGIEVTKDILSKTEKYNKWESFFSSNTKKDDLADSFLQALWYLR
jgi:hypothetical protein